tara:strand:+ start:582 stop:773 length:192 start_codon:yes stop_codon:yes gene_type:complete
MAPKKLAPRPKMKPNLDAEDVTPPSAIGKRAQERNKKKEKEANKKPIKYEIGGMVKPAYMRNR